MDARVNSHNLDGVLWVVPQVPALRLAGGSGRDTNGGLSGQIPNSG